MGKQSFIDPKTYKQLVWADLADDEEEEARLEREIAQQLLVGAGRSRPATAAGTYQPPSLASAAASPRALAPDHQHQQQQQQPLGISGSPSPRPAQDTQQQAAQQQQQQQQQGAPEAGAFLNPFGSDGYRTGPNTPRSVDALLPGVQEEAEAGHPGKGLAPGWQAGQAGFSGAVQHPQHLQQQYEQQQLSAEAEGLLGSSGDVWQQLQWQVTLGNSEEWADAGPVRQLFRKVSCSGAQTPSLVQIMASLCSVHVPPDRVQHLRRLACAALATTTPSRGNPAPFQRQLDVFMPSASPSC
jgi:hypothetical protein